MLYIPCNFGLHNDLGIFTGLQAPNAKLLSSDEFMIHSTLQSPSHEFVQVKSEISTQDLRLVRDRDRNNFTFVQAFSLVVGLNLSWSATCKNSAWHLLIGQRPIQRSVLIVPAGPRLWFVIHL
jgi:hypothetical protein